MRGGDFTAEELENARQAMASELLSLTDSPGALEDFYLSQTLDGLDYGPAELAELCRTVTREDVLAVAGGIELDAVYFLCAGEEEDEEDEEEDHAED